MNIINFNQALNDALNFLIKNQAPKINFKKLNFPIVVGSGNAYNTGLILFAKQPAVFASESTFKEVIKNYQPLIKKKIIKQAVVISASGAKDSTWEIQLAKKYKLKTLLLTCVENSPAAKVADQVKIFKKIPEPYTYNISTYLNMILSASPEKPKDILNFLKKIKLAKNFKNYASYAFILPDNYAPVARMILAKADELFGPHVAIRAFTSGDARHAKFINRTKKELVISFGEPNHFFGEPKHRLDLALPKNHDFGLIFSLAYALLGKIQEVKPPYFKNNIKKYCSDYGPKAYGKNEKLNLIS